MGRRNLDHARHDPSRWTQAPPAKTRLADYYPVRAGSRWTYELDTGNDRKFRMTNQIAKIETIDGKPLARFETVINGMVAGTQHLLSTPEGVFRYRMGDAEISPPLCFLKYPFKEGETWIAEPMIGDEHMKISFKTGRREQVMSLGGKYQAVSVVMEIDVNGNRVKTTSWYAPEVGLVREIRKIGDTIITMSLVKFDAPE